MWPFKKRGLDPTIKAIQDACEHSIVCGKDDVVGKCHCEKCGKVMGLDEGMNYYFDRFHILMEKLKDVEPKMKSFGGKRDNA